MGLESRLQSMEKKLQEQKSASRDENESISVGDIPRGPISPYNLQREHDDENCQGRANCSATSTGRGYDYSLSQTPDPNRCTAPTGSEQTTVIGLDELDPMLYSLPEEPIGSERDLQDVTILPQTLIDTLVTQFYRETYSIFPIIREPDFRKQLDSWRSTTEDSSGFIPVLYALLAVSASILPPDHAVFDLPEARGYKSLDLGDLISSYANSQLSLKSYKGGKLARVNSVIAHGLLSLYLAEAGQVTEAWVTTGHAIRLYQGLDLYDCSSSGLETVDAPNGHGSLWWCLYILDRSLSTVLLKPLAIDDAECDVSSGDDRESHISVSEDEVDPWFSIITDFHITMGKIYKSVRSIRKRQHSDKYSTNEILRSRLKKHDMELEQYYEKQVLPNMKHTPNDSQRMGLQTIAVSSYFIGVVLLYRQFIESFHIEDPEIYLRCAEAASNCIRLTPKVLATVPASHFMIQQSRSIYVSAKVLLHCMRLARNDSFSKKAWGDVEMGLEMLRKIKIQWPEIKKYQKLTEEDMRLTQMKLQRNETFRETFDRFGTLFGDEAHNGPSTSNRASVSRTTDPVANLSGKRRCPSLDTDDIWEMEAASKQQKVSRPNNLLSPDLSSLFQTPGTGMVDDDFTMSFMLDLAALTPGTALASSNIYGNENN